MAQKIASLYAEIGADTTKLEKGLQQTRQGLQGAGKDADSLSDRIGKFATGFGKFALEAGVAALGAAMVKAAQDASELQHSMAQIAALTDTPREAIQGLTKDVIAMSRDMPISANELAKGLYFISSSGFQGAEAMKILNASAKAAATGLGETKTIADAVTSALNAYKLQGSDAARVTDILTQAVKDGKGEPDQLAGSLGRVLPIAAAAGVSMEQVAASMATMTRTGLTADEAATALRGTIGALLAPSKQSIDALAGIGLTVEDVANKLRGDGLVSLLQLLMERTKGNVETLDAIIPNIRALTGVLSTAGSQGEAYARILSNMSNAAGTTDKAFAEMSNTFEFKLKKAQNAIENLGIAVGQKLLPPLSDAADAAATLINWQDKINEAFDKTSASIKTNAKNYNEYKTSMVGVAVAAGKITQAEADLIINGHEKLAESTANLTTLTGDQADAFAMQAMANRTANGMMGDSAGVIDEVTKRTGLLTQAQWEQQHSAEMLSNEMEGGLLQAQRWGKANDEVGYSAVETTKQLKEEAKANKEILDAAAEATIANYNFVASFKDFDAMKGAQQTISDLEDAIKANPENRDNYAAQIRSISQAAGITTPAMEAAAGSFRALEAAWQSGDITTQSYLAALGKIQQAAKDGSVSVDELGLKTGEAAAYMLASTGSTSAAADMFVLSAKDKKMALLDEMSGNLVQQQTELGKGIDISMFAISNSMTTTTSLVQTGVNTLRTSAIVPLQGDLDGLKKKIQEAEAQAKTSAQGIAKAWEQVPRNVTTTYTISINGSVPNPAGGGGGAQHASGADFIVPPGYNDNYPLGYAKSGERVIILTEQEQRQIKNEMTMNVYTQNAPNVINEFGLMRAMLGA